jgi:fatty-acid desaturase
MARILPTHNHFRSISRPQPRFGGVTGVMQPMPTGACNQPVIDFRSLRYPEGVHGSTIKWRHVIAVGGYHLLALMALNSWFFSWAGVALAVIGIPVFGSIGINLCYHRLLSHRSFCCPRWLEHAFAILGVCCLEDTPARWVAIHRQHHHHSDDVPDPHSPLVNPFWAYIGWVIFENKETSGLAIYDRYARDVIRDRFYLWVERLYVGIVLLSWAVFYFGGFLAILALDGTVADAAHFGASVWLWGVIVRTIAVWHITWAGNSVPHIWGYRNYQTHDNSRNNIFVAIITNGEGWHNNHHADPGSASNQHCWWELDLTYAFLRCCVLLGVAWDVRTPRVRRGDADA